MVRRHRHRNLRRARRCPDLDRGSGHGADPGSYGHDSCADVGGGGLRRKKEFESGIDHNTRT